MKKLALILSILVLAVAPAVAEKTYKLDEGIKTIAKGLSTKLAEGAKVVVLDVKSEKSEASAYIEEELTYELLQTDRLVLVDRQNLEAIRQELSLQVSGDVSDESAQRLGAMLGAEVLITGSFDHLADNYRMSVKAVQVETAEIRYLSALSVVSDGETEALFGRKTGASKAVSTAGKAVRNVADFTGRFVCSAVNPAFGIGSYMQGDTAGGRKVAFWEIAGITTFAIGSYRVESELSHGTFLQVLGVGAFGITAVYSLIKPWTYNRNKEIAEVFDHVTLAWKGDDGLLFGYTFCY